MPLPYTVSGTTVTYPARSERVVVTLTDLHRSPTFAIEANAAIDVIVPEPIGHATTYGGGPNVPTLRVANTGTETVTIKNTQGTVLGAVAAGQVATLQPIVAWTVAIA